MRLERLKWTQETETAWTAGKWRIEEERQLFRILYKEDTVIVIQATGRKSGLACCKRWVNDARTKTKAARQRRKNVPE